MPEETKPKRKTGLKPRLAERAAIQSLALAGASLTDIERATGRGRKSIQRVLDSEEMQLARDLAKSALAEHAASFVDNWKRAAAVGAEKGRYEGAEAALRAIGAVEKDSPRQGGSGFTVRIGVVLPGLGIPQGDGQPLTINMPRQQDETDSE